MPYVKDQNGNNILDKDGNKIEYTVTYGSQPLTDVHREPIHVNDGHPDTEN